MTQKKTAPPKKIVLSATELEIAKRFGMTPQQYAQHKAALETDDFNNDPNKQDIMNAPIRTLRDIWEVKFGARWVEVDSFDDEWDKIYGRLMEYDLLEEFDGGMWVKPKEQLCC